MKVEAPKQAAPAKEELSVEDKVQDEELAKKFMITRALNMKEFADFEMKEVQQSVQDLQKKLVETCTQMISEVHKSLVEVVKEAARIEIPTKSNSEEGLQVLTAIERMQKAQEI